MIDTADGGSTLTTTVDELAVAAQIGDPVSGTSGLRSWWIRSGKPESSEYDRTDDSVRANAWIPIAMIAVVAGAFLLRFSAAQHLSSHVDEAASVMAAEMVAEKGFPLFPSDTLYLQGATISYLLAPVIKFGWGDYGNLLPLRFLSVIAGTVSVFLMFKLGRELTRSAAAGFVVALFLAADPSSVQWSGMVRMYALLQCLSLLVIWLFMRSLLRPPKQRELLTLVVAFWLGVFTHVGICLLLPGMAIASALIYGIELLTKRRDLAVALIACGGAPVMLLGLNRLVSPPGKSASQSLPGVSFVGDFLFSSDQILHPTLRSWTLLFEWSDFGVVLPAVVLGATCVLIGRYFLGELPTSRIAFERKRTLTALLVLYWLPIVAVATLATVQSERYLLHIHPLGLMLLVLLVYDLVAYPFPIVQSIRHRTQVSAAHAVAGSARTQLSSPRQRVLVPAPRVPGLNWLEDRVAGRSLEGALPAWLSTRAVATAGLVTVVLLGSLLRLAHLDRLGLWFDEGLTVLYSKQPWRAVAGFEGFYSPHPPLYFSLVKASDLFTASETAGRWVSVIAGIATIPLFYILVARMLDRRAAFVASLVLALSPLHLYYSQEARMYSLVVLFVTLSFLSLVLFHQRSHWGWAALYGVSVALALWSDYSSGFALAPQAVFILVQLFRNRRASQPLLIAGGLAVVAYLPWAPQVLASIDAADLVERQESYLAVDQSSITSALLSVIGFGGDDSYFQSLRATLWNRWPVFRPFMLIGALPVVLLGIKGLWRRWEAMLVIGGLLSTMVIGVWVSLVSPGFAERTVLATVLGWAALVGAAFSARTSRFVKLVGAASLAILLIVQSSTIGVLYDGAVKEEWRSAAADAEVVSPLDIPLITYSYAGAADTLIDVYHPGLLDGMRVITIRDGYLDAELTNGVIPEVGLSRTLDLPAGRLSESLPPTPENDLVWYLYSLREGEGDVHAAIRRAGYTRILHSEYPTPRSQVNLDLYARPNAQIGTPVQLDSSFEKIEGGWVLPEDGASVTSTGVSGAAEMTITNQSAKGREAFVLVDLTGAPSLATLSVDLKTGISASLVKVSVTCLSAAGTRLVTEEVELVQQTGTSELWRTAQVAALCPDGSDSVRLSLMNRGVGDVSFRDPELRFMVVPTTG